jgi:Arc/MetJ-type ribon-helix-helix transcriptional regulator
MTLRPGETQMTVSGKIVVAVEHDQFSLIQRMVAAGEFASPSEIVGEALRTWLHGRGHGPGAERLRDSIRAWRGQQAEPVERVELMFDARDAKA